MTLDTKDKLMLEIEKLEAMLVMIGEHFTQPKLDNKELYYYNLQRNLKWYDACLNIAFDEVKKVKNIIEEVNPRWV